MEEEEITQIEPIKNNEEGLDGVHYHKGTDQPRIDFNDLKNNILEHEDLSGLTNDDHTQYIKEDGTRAFSGNQSLGGNKLNEVGEPGAAQDAATKNYVDTNLTPGGLSIYGNGADGNKTVSGSETITADMYYNNLTIGNSDTLNTSGFRIFVKGTLTIESGGVLTRSANNGSNGANGVPSVGGQKGGGGAALSSGTLYGGLAGANGGDGANTSAGAGTAGNGVALDPGLCGNGTGGGKGGVGKTPATSTDGGTGGTTTAPSGFHIKTMPFAVMMMEFTDGNAPDFIGGAASSGGGGGGGSYVLNQVSGGGGGGAGGSGGVIVVCAKTIVNNGTIEANGGDGGDGGDSYDAGGDWGGGGGGGAGGNGGVIVLIYDSYSGAGAINTNGGTAGVSGGTSLGFSGTNGNQGLQITIQNK